MEFWVARDKNVDLALYDVEPYCPFGGNWHNCNQEFCLDPELFPEVTFENSPQKIEIILKK